MNLQPVKEGSIDDRILCCIVDNGNRASRTVISAHADCNDAILSIALAKLVREGCLALTEEAGTYTVTDAALAANSLEPVHRAPEKRQAPPTESNGEKAGEQGGSAPGLNVAKAAEPVKPRPAVFTRPTTPPEPAMATKQKTGKKCTFCEETKGEDAFYPSQARCKICFNGIAKVGKLRKEGKPIPAHLTRYAAGPLAAPKAYPAKKTVAKIAPAAPEQPKPMDDDSYNDSVVTIAPAGIVECRVAGQGPFAVGIVKQFNQEHRYTLEQLQGLRDWASIVLKREMHA